MSHSKRVTAAVILIGDELLSGRTQDVNLQTIANFLAPVGVQVVEARVIGDERETIIHTVNTLRAAHDYVFTTGGIGPTHDDITADCIAAAFGIEIEENPQALAILKAGAEARGRELTPLARRMARIPVGAHLIQNAATGAPGFQTGNVFTLAGVPSIARAMLEDVEHRIEGGAVVYSRTLALPGRTEGQIGAVLADVQTDLADRVAIGSYPHFTSPQDYGVNVVVRGTDEGVLDTALDAIRARLD